MSEKVVFSQLSRKFIDENDATPDAAQQVVYYSLAIGHHLGVIDCLEAALSCPWSDYLAWIATLEEGSTAQRKMEGVPLRNLIYLSPLSWGSVKGQSDCITKPIYAAYANQTGPFGDQGNRTKPAGD